MSPNRSIYQPLELIFKISALILVGIVYLNSQNVIAQDLVLENITVNTSETYSASNSITAGPSFTISGTGQVTFKSGNLIILKPGFVVIAGGEFYGLTNVGTYLDKNDDPDIIMDFDLKQNYPNPFNPVTNITYLLPEKGFVILKIYDVLGKEIETLVSEIQGAGKYSISFDAHEMASGVYIYKLQVKDRILSKKMILMR